MARPTLIHLRYLRTVAVSALAVLGVVTGVNAAMDPLWCMGTEHALNHRKLGFDERQQKTNALTFRPAPYDAVLLGSSRSAFIDARGFTGSKVFNYGADDLSPAEASVFLTYAAHRLGPKLKRAFVGIDFESSNGLHPVMPGQQYPTAYLRTVGDPLYRFKMLLSGDAFGRSLESLSLNLAQATHKDFYDASLLKAPRRTDDAVMLRRTTRYMNAYRRRFRFAYHYRSDYPSTLQTLRVAAPGAQIVTFSPPTSAMFLAVLEQEGRFEDYKRWLRETVVTTGGFHHFNYPNSVTRDLRNFLDGQHLRPEVSRWVAAKVAGRPLVDTPADFGVYLTPENVEAFLGTMRF